jgi:hypothetical protein
LAKASRKWIEKLYFFVEGCKLYFYQKNVKHAQSVWSVASDDADYMRRHFPNVPVVHLPCFHSHDELMIMPGKSDYVLYHGNLALAENESAALFLIKEVFPRLPYRCVVAGRRPNPVLYQAASQVDNVEIMANPSQEEMDLLVKEAHIHLLYTAQPTGLKLKLLNVLYQGRHIVANSHMLAGTDLLNSRVCHVAETAEQLVQQCLALKNTAVGNEHIATRAKFLQSTYSMVLSVISNISNLLPTQHLSCKCLYIPHRQCLYRISTLCHHLEFLCRNYHTYIPQAVRERLDNADDKEIVYILDPY